MRCLWLSSLLLLLSSPFGNGVFPVAAALAQGPLSATGGAPEKPQIVANLYARNLEVTLGLVKDYLPVPVKPEGALSVFFGDFSDQVALSAPVSAIVGVDLAAGGQKDEGPPPPLWAFSVGVRNLDAAQKQAQGRGYVTDGKPGALRLKLGTGSRSLYCLLSGSPSSGRLTCSPKERGRDLLSPYLVRPSAPPQAQTSDLHAEIFVDQLLAAYDGSWRYGLKVLSVMAPTRLKLNQPAFDRALTDVTQAAVEQLQAMAQDLQTIALDLSINKVGIELRLAYRLVGQNSWWAQAEAQPSSLGGAPPVFFTLPADSSAASFQSSDPKWAKKVLDLLVPLLDGYLTHEGMAAADRKAVAEVLTRVADASRAGPLTTVMASGKSEQPTAATSGIDLSALLGGTYYLVAAEGANEWTIPWLKSVLAAYNRPGVQAFLRARWKKLDPTGPLPTLKAEPVAKTLPPGGYGLVLTGNFAALLRDANVSAGKAPPKAHSIALHLFTVPSEGRLWSALGSDKAALTLRLAEATKPQKTLAQRGGLESLRDPSLRSGGFTSLVALSSYLDALLITAQTTKGLLGGQGRAERAVSSSQLFTLAPHHGEVPMVYLSKVGPAEASGRTSELILRVPRMVIEDIAALVMQLALEK